MAIKGIYRNPLHYADPWPPCITNTPNPKATPMNLSQIQSRLADVFSAQEADPDRAGTAVVMWFDPNGEFYDALGELELPDGVELLVEEPNHLFELKCRLNQDLSG